MPASFITLPPEISTQIIRNVEKSGWLLDLALCCHSIYYVTLPCLYTDVKLLYNDSTRGFRLIPFTTHMVRNPELASYVRGFTLEEQWLRRDYESSRGLQSPRLDESVRGVVSRSSLSQVRKRTWIRALEIGDQSSFIALLLSSLPNLRCLSMEGLWPSLHVEELFQSASRRESFLYTKPALSSLRVLILENKSLCRISPDLLSSYLQLPSLREFYGEKIRVDRFGHLDDKTNEPLATLKSATTSLDHLEIREGSLRSIGLPNVLRASKNFRIIVYEVGLNSLFTCSTLEIRKALIWNQNILENLWLDLWDGSRALYWGEDLSPMGSLSSFTLLKNLWVGMHMFFGVEFHGRRHAPDLASLMPPSIETLYFSRTKGRVNRLTSALEKLLQAKQSHTPKLRMVAFEAEITGEDKHFDYSRLDFLAKASGVGIVKIDCTWKKNRRAKDRTSNFHRWSPFYSFTTDLRGKHTFLAPQIFHLDTFRLQEEKR